MPTIVPITREMLQGNSLPLADLHFRVIDALERQAREQWARDARDAVFPPSELTRLVRQMLAEVSR